MVMMILEEYERAVFLYRKMLHILNHPAQIRIHRAQRKCFHLTVSTSKELELHSSQSEGKTCSLQFKKENSGQKVSPIQLSGKIWREAFLFV